MANELRGKVIAFLIAPEGAEQVELVEPWRAVESAGGRPVLIAPVDKAGAEAQLFQHLDKGDRQRVDMPLSTADVAEYDALVLPGGVANPDMLRTDPEAVRFVRRFFSDGKPVAAICHAPWMLIEAHEASGRTLTSWPSLHTDLSNAGAAWVDEPVVICEKGNNTLVTSRKPDDLPSFNEAVVKVFSAA